jgi:hypothetical protein
VVGIARRRRVDSVLSAGGSFDDGRVLIGGAVFAKGGASRKGIVSNGICGSSMAIGHRGLLVEAETVPENIHERVVVVVV